MNSDYALPFAKSVFSIEHACWFSFRKLTKCILYRNFGEGTQFFMFLFLPQSSLVYGHHLWPSLPRYSSVQRKTKRWSMTVFQHLLDIAVTNSFIKNCASTSSRSTRHARTSRRSLLQRFIWMPGLSPQVKGTFLGALERWERRRERVWEGSSVLCAREALIGCVSSAM